MVINMNCDQGCDREIWFRGNSEGILVNGCIQFYHEAHEGLEGLIQSTTLEKSNHRDHRGVLKKTIPHGPSNPELR